MLQLFILTYETIATLVIIFYLLEFKVVYKIA
jgi:hypothetical protein